MKKLTKKQCAKRFFIACLKWLKLFEINDYELRVSITDLEQTEGKDFRIQAENITQVKYMSVDITGDFIAVQNMSDYELDELARHEVLHTIIAPVTQLLDEVIELLPKAKQQPYNNWRSREVEGTVTHLTTVTGLLHKAPKGKIKND